MGYDEEMPERMGFRLNEKGQKKASIEENTMDKLSNAMQTDLFTEMQYQKDTYTQEEMNQMFRKRKTRKVKKKKSKRKKTEAIPVELREEMNESEKLRASKPFEQRYGFLQNVETTGEDRGKRSDGSLAQLKQKLEDAKEDQRRKYNYKKALEKAEKDQWLLRAVEQDEEEAEE